MEATDVIQHKPITGGCYCGAVRFRAVGETLYRANCHCANCRRAIGAQVVAWITVKTSEFAFEKGSPKHYRTDTEAWRTFCDQCGTSLTYENDARPGEIDITTGSLDHPEDFPPTKDVFPEEKLPWVVSAGAPLPRQTGHADLPHLAFACDDLGTLSSVSVCVHDWLRISFSGLSGFTSHPLC